jgi:hypothetical protein
MNLARRPELAVVFSRGYTVGFMCSLWCFECTNIDDFVIYLNLGGKRGSAMSIGRYPLEPGKISSVNYLITIVLFIRCFAQILPSVIRSIVVPVIYVFGRIISRDQFPDNAVDPKYDRVDRDISMACVGEKTRLPPGVSCIPPSMRIPSDEMRQRALSPRQKPGLRVVIEAFAKIRLIGQGAFSHSVLLFRTMVRGGGGVSSTFAASSYYQIPRVYQ